MLQPCHEVEISENNKYKPCLVVIFKTEQRVGTVQYTLHTGKNTNTHTICLKKIRKSVVLLTENTIVL